MDYNYRIVVFEDDSDRGSKKVFDIIPISWLIYKESEPNQIYCYFMPPPYSTSRINKLKRMVINNSKPDVSWPTYAIDIKGRASKYFIVVESLIFERSHVTFFSKSTFLKKTSLQT